MKDLEWILIQTQYACGGVGVDHDGVIRDSCPIFRKWIIGKRWEEVKHLRWRKNDR